MCRAAIRPFGAVSREVVEEMALQVAAKMSDCSIAVSGGGSRWRNSVESIRNRMISHPVARQTMTQRYQFGLSREENINRHHMASR